MTQKVLSGYIRSVSAGMKKKVAIIKIWTPLQLKKMGLITPLNVSALRRHNQKVNDSVV